MLKKARAFIALIAFITSISCDITVYTKDNLQLDLEYNDQLSTFGEKIPSDGIKVFKLYFL